MPTELAASTYYTKQVGTAGETRHKTTPRVQTPRMVRVRRDLAGSSEPVADYFDIYKLKVGQTLIPGMSYLTTDTGGTTLNINIGDSVDPNGYAEGIDLSTAGKIDFVSGGIPAYEDAPHVATEATSDVIVAISASGTPAAASVVFYLAIMDEYAEQ